MTLHLYTWDKRIGAGNETVGSTRHIGGGHVMRPTNSETI